VPKLPAQGDETLDLRVDGHKMIGHEGVDRLARGIRLIQQRQQGADRAHLEAQLTGMPDEYQSTDIAGAIAAAIARGSQDCR
jgi:hypothetical protein